VTSAISGFRRLKAGCTQIKKRLNDKKIGHKKAQKTLKIDEVQHKSMKFFILFCN
jgi:hypothetical protein